MSQREYQKAILNGLLKKYHNRRAKNIITNRRVVIKPTELYKGYAKNNADLFEKQALNEAAVKLSEMGFITRDYLKFSDEIEKIYLSEEQIPAVYDYLKDEYGIVPQHTISQIIGEIVGKYCLAGKITQSYCEMILAQSEDPRVSLFPERVEANLKMIAFLEKNEETLYLREASMLVYGDSKWFEANNCEEVCTFIRMAIGQIKEEGEQNDAVLSIFHIIPAEQEVFIKGDWKIEWDQYVLDVSKMKGGIAITSSDIKCIKNIKVDTENVITIENKISFQRMKDKKFAMMYLGGFASKLQTEFLIKVISDNPNAKYYHFGDIDIGGFFIHKHLCRETSKKFELYCMGIQQLSDPRYRHCLKNLTDSDRNRLETLLKDSLYQEVLTYMKNQDSKLEQEIISYYLEKKTT